jgi:hypothetical protein
VIVPTALMRWFVTLTSHLKRLSVTIFANPCVTMRFAGWAAPAGPPGAWA